MFDVPAVFALTLSFFDGKGNFIELFAAVFKTAGLGALPQIGRSFVDPCGHEAMTGKGEAHCAVHENFKFHVRKLSDDVCHVVFAEFACQIYPLHAGFLPKFHGGGVDGMGLGGKVDFKIRTMFFGKPKHAGVRNDKRVNACFRQGFEHADNIAELPVIRHGVEAIINFRFDGMGFLHAESEFFKAEAVAFRTQGKFVTA